MNLKAEIDAIKIIDHHAHVMDPWYWNDALGQAPPFPPHIHGLDVPDDTASLSKTKRLIPMFQTLYGFVGEQITAENEVTLRAAYEESKKDEPALYHRVMDLAGIEIIGEVCLSRPVLAEGLDPKRFGRIAFSDGLIVPLDNSGLKKPMKKSELFLTLAEVSARNLEEAMGFHPSTFDERVQFIDAAAEYLKKDGCIAMKSSCGYWRGLDFEDVSEADARAVFESGDTSRERYKLLQDYLQLRIFRACGRNGLVFQMHTGGGGQEGFLRGNDPSLLDKVLWHADTNDCSIVMLHGGYPYCREAGFMVGSFGQRQRPLFLDTSIMWMDHPTPRGATVRAVLRDWLECGLASKLVYGSDATSPFKVWISAMNIREDLGVVLGDMVADELVTERQALDMAYKVLRGNSERIYAW